VASPFEALDFLYVPSRDVAADAGYFATVLGAEHVFSIEAYGTRVAMLRLAADGPAILFADHLEGERPILVHRVANLEDAMAELAERGWEPAPVFGIPHGPCCAFDTPGGQRLAIYELTRPEVEARFAGRRDF
jgi:hypothetical protein